MLSIGQALVSATGFFGRSPTRQASSPRMQDEREWAETDETAQQPADAFSRGAPCFDAVEAALKDAGYLDS
ncbi:hypothetical protein [Methylobacterium iners]|uniref:Uncharacterized protein n=1 Tax=Methylobacterium iners TaxID=418707 RepID=A0ABQ4S603_9HYPH|nr:hypothetical protein [Methylobacterium iners]GJD97547.1 hypothetical protein OCOJLMKI_4779 [Methylobacterium iners]